MVCVSGRQAALASTLPLPSSLGFLLSWQLRAMGGGFQRIRMGKRIPGLGSWARRREEGGGRREE